MAYGWKYYFEPTPKNVSRWLLGLRAAIGLTQGAAVLEHASVATQLTLLIIGGILHEFGMLFAEAPKKEG